MMVPRGKTDWTIVFSTLKNGGDNMMAPAYLAIKGGGTLVGVVLAMDQSMLDGIEYL